jgi:hypothetical protein
VDLKPPCPICNQRDCEHGLNVFRFVTAAHKKAITTPHDHECTDRRPLWLVWRLDKAMNGMPYFPVLDSVCDSEDSAYYHVGAAVEGHRESEVFVERVPANHRFASSLPEWQVKIHHHIVKNFHQRDENGYI